MNIPTRPLGRILAVALVLSLPAIACGFNINLPVTRVETGPTQTMDLQVPAPEGSGGAELRLEFAAGDLKLAPGAGSQLVAGTARYNVDVLEPVVEEQGASVTIRPRDVENQGFPLTTDDIINEWDLQLGDTPLRLAIQAGAYAGNFELGGLSLEQLTVSEGGSEVSMAFSSPNRVEMSTFAYTTGASSAKLAGLANANFANMNFSSGAGEYTLSFDGDLQRDASIDIDAGLSTMTIIVPDGVQAQVVVDGVVSVNTAGGWTQQGDAYSNSGSGPLLTFTIDMGAGTLNLKNE